MNLNAEQNANFLELDFFLKKHNMNIRLDSELCLNYILFKNGNLNDILLNLQKARFLHEYCDFTRGYNLALQIKGVQKLPKKQWLNLINNCVLQSNGITAFPAMWPWEN